MWEENDHLHIFYLSVGCTKSHELLPVRDFSYQFTFPGPLLAPTVPVSSPARHFSLDGQVLRLSQQPSTVYNLFLTRAQSYKNSAYTRLCLLGQSVSLPEQPENVTDFLKLLFNMTHKSTHMPKAGLESDHLQPKGAETEKLKPES